MLVLSRKPMQSIMIGPGIKITIVKVERNQVRIGIEAPRDLHDSPGGVDRDRCRGKPGKRSRASQVIDLLGLKRTRDQDQRRATKALPDAARRSRFSARLACGIANDHRSHCIESGRGRRVLSPFLQVYPPLQGGRG